jgi:hypothetical protein
MRINATFAQQQIALQYVVVCVPSAQRCANGLGIREVRRPGRVFSPMIPPPLAVSRCNPSFPRKRSSSSPLSSRRLSRATCLPSRPFNTSSCASGSTRARSDGQSSSCFLREVPGRSRALIRPTRHRSCFISCALLPSHASFLRSSG